MPTSTIELRTGTTQPYARPVLQVYGDVKMLTASGTSGGSETGNQPTCSINTAKRPC
jgi:hypothetical protein